MAFRRDRTEAGPARRFLELPGDWEDPDGAPSRAGWVVSGAGHLGLVLFLLVGGFLDSAPLPPMQVAEVTVISEEEFAALTRPEETPEAAEGVTAPALPETPTEAPTRPPARPDIAEAPPEAAEPAPPAPPEPPVPAEPAPPGPAELTAPPPLPPTPEPPAPEAAPRVAPEAAPEAPPEAAEAPTVVEETAPEPEPEPETVVEEQEPAAPPEAATEIVTEAERPSGAPDAAPRPRARPDRVARIDPGRTVEARSEPEPEPPAPEPVPQPEAEPQQVPDDDMAAAIAGAVADAISNAPEGAPETGAAAGPPLSQGEQDAFRVSVQRCWIVDPGSPAASVTVVVGMRLTRDAKPDTASISLLGSRGGDDGATRAAFEAARRAILRCGAEGFPLPPEKYERWAEVEMTFNPEEMRIR